MKSNLSRWGLSRYYITKEGILYFKTLNKGWVKKPFRLLESKKRKKYTQSLLNDEGKYVYGYLHRLVAMAYIPNPNNYPIVRHLNDNPLDNRLANLAWGTQKDNMSQASKDGRMIQAKGKDSVHYKGTEIQRSYIPRLINLGFTRKEISEIMNLGVQLVSDYYNKYKETYG